jgi:hypothetical protein
MYHQGEVDTAAYAAVSHIERIAWKAVAESGRELPLDFFLPRNSAPAMARSIETQANASLQKGSAGMASDAHLSGVSSERLRSSRRQ